MAKLRNRQMFIPNGFKFYQPETGWTAPRNTSFELVVQALIAHRKANPYLREKHNWSINHDVVVNEVDRFNADLCEKMGWTDYILPAAGATPPPKPMAPSPSDQSRVAAAAGQVKKIWSGIRTLSEWYDSKEPGVPPDVSLRRAEICVACPLNQPGDFSQWFTKPAAEAIRRQVEKFSDRRLSTPYDDRLHTCSACLCVNKLSVHAPIKLKRAHLSPETEADIRRGNPNCWVLTEANGT